MNKSVPLLAVMLNIALAASAQPAHFNNFKKISFIAEGGANLTTINGESQLIFFPASKLKPGFTGGLTIQLKIARNVFIQAGANYATKGSGKGNNVNPGLLYDWDVNRFNINYLEVPVNLIYHPSFAQGRLFLGAGVFYAKALSARVKYSDGSALDIEFVDHQNVKGLFPGPFAIKPSDYGINILGGYDINHRLFAKFTSQWGLKNISPDYNSDTYLNSRVYHTAGITLSLGYRL